LDLKPTTDVDILLDDIVAKEPLITPSKMEQVRKLILNATKRWRSSKATKQTRTHRCKTFKCCKMLLEDEGDKTRPRGCK